VFISAGAATALAAVTVAGAANRDESLLVPVIAAWWAAATLIGLWLGRKHTTSPPIAGLLAQARAATATTLPEMRPGMVLLNRLWPLLISTIAAGGVAFLAPQVAGIACGFAIIWALAWRHQEKAVTAIEERDGVAFFVERTSPFQPIQLVRTQAFRRDVAPVL
jgi:hypothetical protein